jgi:hypothetical protein
VCERQSLHSRGKKGRKEVMMRANVAPKVSVIAIKTGSVNQVCERRKGRARVARVFKH